MACYTDLGPARMHRNGPITLHVDGAARATLLAAETAATGIFNIVDDGGPISNAKAKSVLARPSKPNGQ